MFDSAIVNAYYKGIPPAIETSLPAYWANGYTYSSFSIPCGLTLPNIDLSFGSASTWPSAKIFGATLVNQTSRDAQGRCTTNFISSSYGNCFGAPLFGSNVVAFKFPSNQIDEDAPDPRHPVIPLSWAPTVQFAVKPNNGTAQLRETRSGIQLFPPGVRFFRLGERVDGLVLLERIQASRKECNFLQIDERPVELEPLKWSFAISC